MDDLKKLSDEQLVARYGAGENEAFDVLLARYQAKLYTYIHFTVRNEDAANDLFQETFVKAIVTIQQGRYVDSGKFSAWITRIAHNLLIDRYRLEKNENWVSNDDVEGDLFNDASLSDANVEMRMVAEQSLNDVSRLVSELPANQREVIYMRFYQDLSFKEIAEITGVSINTALGRVRYALLNLRRMIEERKMVLTIY
jgi:RNA polymerase sigma factor (sigma-70 family)